MYYVTLMLGARARNCCRVLPAQAHTVRSCTVLFRSHVGRVFPAG